MFAPAFTPGDPASEAEAQRWMARHYRVTNPVVEQSRSPVSFSTGNPAGMVDVEALRALAQGGDYDVNARRNAIAAAVQAQQAAAQQPQPLTGALALRARTPKVAGYDDSWLGGGVNDQAEFDRGQWDAMNAMARQQAMNPLLGFGGGSSS